MTESSKKRLTFLLLLLILLLAAILRLYGLGAFDLATESGEVGMIADAVLFEGEYTTSITRAFVYSLHRVPFSAADVHFLTLLTLHFFGPGEFCFRLPVALAGVLAVLLTYLLGKELYDRRVGLLAALFLATSPLHVYYTRMRLIEHFSTIWITLALLFFWRNENLRAADPSSPVTTLVAWLRGSRYLLLAIAAIWMGSLNRDGVLMLVPAFVAYLTVTQWPTWLRRRELWIGLCILVSPALVSVDKVVSFMQSRFWGGIVGLLQAKGTTWATLPLAPFKGVALEGYYFWLFHSSLMTLVVIASLAWLFHKRRRADIYLLCSIGAYSLLFAIYPERHPYYWIFYIPALMIAPALFLSEAAEQYLIPWVRQRWNGYRLVFPAIILALLLSNGRLLKQSIATSPWQAPAPEDKCEYNLRLFYHGSFGVAETADALVRLAAGRPFIVFSYSQAGWKSLAIYFSRYPGVNERQLHTVRFPGQDIHLRGPDMSVPARPFATPLERWRAGEPSAEIDSASVSFWRASDAAHAGQVERDWLALGGDRVAFWILQYDWEYVGSPFSTSKIKETLFRLHPGLEPAEIIYYEGKPVYVIYMVQSAE
jgi:4-amino-4-deoxy-L-arabinose transferase-like glycosyltransferase